jgi:hypothetical protein
MKDGRRLGESAAHASRDAKPDARERVQGARSYRRNTPGHAEVYWLLATFHRTFTGENSAGKRASRTDAGSAKSAACASRRASPDARERVPTGVRSVSQFVAASAKSLRAVGCPSGFG